MKPFVSVCAIAKDEAQHVEQFMQSAGAVADEVIVVDTGSSDGTQEAFSARGAQVFSIPFTGDFGGARNAAIDRATGDWILFLDCDERLVGRRDELDSAIHVLNSGPRPCGVPIVRHNIYPNGHFYSDRVLRLFERHPSVRYTAGMGESVWRNILAAGGEVSDYRIAVSINHLGPSQDEERLVRKFTAYERALQRQLESGAGTSFTHGLLSMFLCRLGRIEEALSASAASVHDDPPFPYIWFLRAHVMHGVGELAAGAAAIARALEWTPNDSLLRNLQGVIAMESGATTEAAIHFESALSLEPHLSPAVLNLAALNPTPAVYDLLGEAVARNPALAASKAGNAPWRACDGGISDLAWRC